jgi:hypothetical protein
MWGFFSFLNFPQKSPEKGCFLLLMRALGAKCSKSVNSLIEEVTCSKRESRTSKRFRFLRFENTI